MGLQIWLPMNGNLNNQGLNSSTATGGVVNGNGKIGLCYLANKSTPITISQNIPSTSEWSVAFWAKFPASMGTSTAWETMFVFPTINSNAGSNSSNVISWTSYYNIKIWDETNHQWFWAAPGKNFNYDMWHHWVFTNTANGEGVQCKIYIDGNLIGTYNNTTHQLKIRSGNITIGSGISTGGFYINDFRLYDNELDANQIKKISMGLIAHYPLSDRYNTSNLIYNGYGEYSSDGWSGVTATTADLPSDPLVKAVFIGGTTIGKIPVNVNDTFTVSCYVKANGSTSGYTYPSILPYDIDKKFIANTNCQDGFNTSWSATLTQPLNKGDTVIHCSDLSAWTTATNNYYYFIAIFGYKDSFGNVYPDFTYTADSLSFGSYSDKSRLNKTNNTITLLSAYTGEPRPIGTKVCQATAGGTYYYPFGGIALSSIQDWTFKTNTFSFSNVNRLKYAKYIEWFNYTGGKYAGIKISDNTLQSNIVHDTSGYNRNGMQIGNFNVTQNTVKHKISTAFNGSSYITSDSLPAETKTVSLWIKTNGVPSAGVVIFVDYGSKLSLGFYGGDSFIVHNGSSSGGTGSRVLLGSYYKSTEWNHVVIIKTGSNTYDVYLNCNKLSSTSSNYWVMSKNEFIIGCRYSSSYNAYFSGQISDFRAYATALSAEDILELYKTPSYLASNAS